MTTRASEDPGLESGAAHPGPNPGVVAGVFMALFVAGLVPVTLLVGDTHFPAPMQPPEQIVAFFRGEAGLVELCALLQFGSAIPLGIYTATMVSRLRYHGTRAAGATIALFGGLLAAGMLALSALIQWTVAQPGIAADEGVTLALHQLIYAVGGPGYTVPLGLLIAGLAVTAGLMRLIPRWLAVCGLLIAAVGELSALSLRSHDVLFLVPLTRFPGFVWLIAAGLRVPRRARR